MANSCSARTSNKSMQQDFLWWEGSRDCSVLMKMTFPLQENESEVISLLIHYKWEWKLHSMPHSYIQTNRGRWYSLALHVTEFWHRFLNLVILFTHSKLCNFPNLVMELAFKSTRAMPTCLLHKLPWNREVRLYLWEKYLNPLSWLKSEMTPKGSFV